MKAASELTFMRPREPEEGDADGYTLYEDDEYGVAARETRFDPDGPAWTHLVIHRQDAQPIHSWADMQTIKNELCGDQSEALELYPAEGRLLDRANAYHLWVIPEHERFWLGMEGDRDKPDPGPAFWWTFTRHDY